MFDNPPPWLKQRVRLSFDDLRVTDAPVTIDLRRSGIAPFWRGWWLIELVPAETGGLAFVDIEFDGGRADRRQVVRVVLSGGRSSKRLVRADWRVRRLTLRPAAGGQPYALTSLALAPALNSFAVRHMRGLLAPGSRDLRGRPRKEAGGLPAGGAGDTVDALALYRRYDEALHEIGAGGQRLYERWIRTVEPGLMLGPDELPTAGPTVSVVMPVHNPPERHLRRAIESVLGQHYPHWELCIADDASDAPHVRAVIEEYALRAPRVKAVFGDSHGHISRTSNRALALAGGDFVAFLDHDDELSPHALGEVAAVLHERPTLDLVYSDEDFLDPSGRRCSPHFKSDWNPYLLYSHNYVTHLCVYRRSLLTRAGGLREGVEGAQDYDLVLRCSRLTGPARIHHIPKILYHWRMAETSTAANADRKGYTDAAGRRALADHFSAQGVAARVESAGSDNFYRVQFESAGPPPLVSLIVPTRDRVGLLRQCVDGLLHRTAYRPLEIVIVDNGSCEADTHAYLERLQRQSDNVRVLRVDEPFNFARLCNLGAAEARGAVIGFINNDIDVIHADWLDEMVMLAQRPEVGCVGAKLLYADETVQHAGVIVGLGGYAAHSHRCFSRDSGGYFNRLKVRQNLSAVTAACLVVRRAAYEAVGGMDEELAVAYNDVDLGLKMRESGLLNVFTPFARLYHFESKSRGYDDTPEKQARFQREKDYLAAKWGERIRLDPYYNPNLTHAREDFTLAV